MEMENEAQRSATQGADLIAQTQDHLQKSFSICESDMSEGAEERNQEVGEGSLVVVSELSDEEMLGDDDLLLNLDSFIELTKALDLGKAVQNGNKDICLEIKPNPLLSAATYCVSNRDLSSLKYQTRRL